MLLTKLTGVFAIVCGMLLSSSSHITENEINKHFSISSLDIKQEPREKCRDKNRAQIEQHKQKKLAYIAQYFGIETKGKSLTELRDAIEQAKKEQPEKWALLKQEMQERKLKLLEQKNAQPVK